MVWLTPGVVKVFGESKRFEGTPPQPAEKRRVGHLYVYMS
jgi:hypothetical protein